MITFVTGGLGFIGSNFVISHLKKYPSQELFILDNFSYSSNKSNLNGYWDDWRVNSKNVDIRNLEALEAMYATFTPEITYHFAAESHVDNSIAGDDIFVATNILGTHNILKCVRKYGGRLIHISTDEVYGSLPLEGEEKFTEDTPYNPRNPYSATKAASDHLVRAYVNTHGLDAIVTNCSNNYGPRQHYEKFVPTAIRHILDNHPVPVYGNGQNVRDWLFVDDHCDALLTIGENAKKGERYNIGGGVELSNVEMVSMILDVMGKPVHMYQDWIKFVEDRKGHDLRYSMDSSKLLRDLGWSAKCKLAQGLEQTVEWYHNA
jgi:dTDP-glucose 4,6-dehydratase